jgi:hypothetical protein
MIYIIEKVIASIWTTLPVRFWYYFKAHNSLRDAANNEKIKAKYAIQNIY